MTTPDIDIFNSLYVLVGKPVLSSANLTYIWSTALYVAATRGLRKVDQKHLDIFEL